jgi:hypothetical protein
MSPSGFGLPEATSQVLMGLSASSKPLDLWVWCVGQWPILPLVIFFNELANAKIGNICVLSFVFRFRVWIHFGIQSNMLARTGSLWSLLGHYSGFGVYWQALVWILVFLSPNEFII